MIQLLARIRKSILFIAPVFTLLTVIVCAESAAADNSLYVVRGKRGVITFTSRKPTTTDNFEVFKPQNAGFSVVRSWYWSRWSGGRGISKERIKQFEGAISQAAEDASLDPALVKAVVHVESGFNCLAKSNKGAMGLMQLMPGTARRFGVRDAYHPEDNLRGGTKYLRWLLDHYSGNLRLALAAYNAGEGAVDQYQQIPPYSETQEYVRRVLATIPDYRCGTNPRTNAKQNC